MDTFTYGFCAPKILFGCGWESRTFFIFYFILFFGAFGVTKSKSKFVCLCCWFWASHASEFCPGGNAVTHNSLTSEGLWPVWVILYHSLAKYPLKPPLWVSNHLAMSSHPSSPLQVFSTICFLNASGPNLTLSVGIRSHRKAEFTGLSQWLWMLATVRVAPGFVMTRFTRRFQIQCHPTETKIANSLSFSGLTPFAILNRTRLQPNINPQLSVGQEEYFLDHSCLVRDHIIFCSGE
jgi:hypothetical protein